MNNTVCRETKGEPKSLERMGTSGGSNQGKIVIL
jgi:hypothetical protein